MRRVALFALAALAVLTAVLVASLPGRAERRLYSESSPLNTRIPDDAAVDPRSDDMARTLLVETAAIPAVALPIASGVWTQPIYEVGAGTPRHDVTLRHEPYRGYRLADVPIPDSAEPSPDGDSTLVLLDREAGCEYDFQRIRREDGRWVAHFGNALPTEGPGIYPFAESPRASGFANAAGVIRPEELRDGQIRHALAFVLRHTKAGGPVPPATGSDGWSSDPGAVPEGARVQLDPGLDLRTLDLEPWQRVVARALQVYGMYLIDTGGNIGIQAQLSSSSDVAYPWGDAPYASLPAELVEELRVLELRPQFETVYRFVPNRCVKLVRPDGSPVR